MTLGLPFLPPEGRSAKKPPTGKEADASENGSGNGSSSRNGGSSSNGSNAKSSNGACAADHREQNGQFSSNCSSSNGSGRESTSKRSNSADSNPSHSNSGDSNVAGANGGGSTSPANGPEGAGFEVNDRFTRKPSVSQQNQMDALEERVERLSSICEAMWHLISEEFDFDLDQLTNKLTEIGSSGAIEDHEHSTDDTVCPNCGKSKPADAALCLFCSAGTR